MVFLGACSLCFSSFLTVPFSCIASLFDHQPGGRKSPLIYLERNGRLRRNVEGKSHVG